MNTDLRALARTGAIHFMGISGAGMSALAELIARDGGIVTGCDTKPGAVAESLRTHGVTVGQGHDPEHVSDAVALVMTSAVRPDHPEIMAARARGIPVLKRAQALGSVVNRGVVVAVCGTHGKTTTTAATTAILDAAHLDPTGIVGGRMPEWGGGLRAGSDEIFVVEADEYDRSFLTLRPTAAVVTNVEADHLDIYGDLAGVESAFVDFLRHVRPDGLIAACCDDEGATRVATRAASTQHVLTYGTSDRADLRAIGIRQDGRAMTFTVMDHGSELGELVLRAPGLHNVRNALGAFAAARHAGATFDDARTALATFSGVSRRFSELGTARGITVIDDYAHHPTEIAATLAAARGTYPDRRIIAAFQPHLYSRTREHAVEFGRALAAADIVMVTDIYAAREQPIEGITGMVVSDAATRAGHANVHYSATLADMGHSIRHEMMPGDVVVAMGAGDIDEMAFELFNDLSIDLTNEG
jgi:UDP-N-acetylmuramate--alanine ligase